MADAKISALAQATSVGDTDEFVVNDSGTTKKVQAQDIISTGVAGNGLTGGGGDPLAVNVDGSTIEIDTDALRIKSTGVSRVAYTDFTVADPAGSSDYVVTNSIDSAVGILGVGDRIRIFAVATATDDNCYMKVTAEVHDDVGGVSDPIIENSVGTAGFEYANMGNQSGTPMVLVIDIIIASSARAISLCNIFDDNDASDPLESSQQAVMTMADTSITGASTHLEVRLSLKDTDGTDYVQSECLTVEIIKAMA